jgi:hypothetical protein
MKDPAPWCLVSFWNCGQMVLIHTSLKIKVKAEANGYYKPVRNKPPAVLQQNMPKMTIFWVVGLCSLVKFY